MILELSHVILGHTHRGMWVYPTAMTATLLLQHSAAGLERGEMASHLIYDKFPPVHVGELMDKLEWLKREVSLRGSRIHWEGGRYVGSAVCPN